MGLILALFLIVRILEVSGQLPLLASSYADDLLCLPLVLGLVLWAHRRLLGRGSAYTLPRSHGLLTLLLFACYFEALLPRWKSSAIADPWDLLMYALGYLVFEMVMNKTSGDVSGELRQEPV